MLPWEPNFESLARCFWQGGALLIVFCVGATCGVGVGAAQDEGKAPPEEARVYVGTYTGGESEGIYLCRLNLKTGALSDLRLVAESENPSFLALAPGGKHLYAVNEVGEFRGEKSGAVSAFAVDEATGGLTLLNQQPSRGGAPCHLVVDKTGRHVLVANYSGGSVASLPIQNDGRLGAASSFVQHEGSSVNPRRQEGPHGHSINLDANNRFAYAADLGLDKVLIYRFDEQSGALAAAEPASASVKPGAGPRHFALHTSGRHAYVINELDSTITAFACDRESGALSSIQTVSTLPEGFEGNSYTADVQVHRSGRFLYGSNRGHDSIAVFAIDANDGKLSLVEIESTQGKTPRNFGIDPTGTFLLAANQGTNNIVSFRIDQQTGALSPTGHVIEAPKPVCLKMVAAER